MEGFLYQASIYLAAAVIAVPIAARLGLGSVLGYLAAGIIITLLSGAHAVALAIGLSIAMPAVLIVQSVCSNLRILSR